MTDRDARLARLSREQRLRLIERIRKTPTAANAGEEQTAAIPRRDPSAPAPLSFSQQRLWFLEQLAPGNPFYNESMAVRLSGPIEAAALERSLNAVIARHEVLRTTFGSVDGQPRPQIAPDLTIPLEPLDLRADPPARREAQARRLARAVIQRPFDLARGPLIRAALLRLDADEHVLVVALHHIISDGWSMDVLIRELATFYTAYQGGQPAALPELPIQYADYAAWQRAWLEGAGADGQSPLQQQLAYWRRQLADLPALALPADYERPAVQSYRGASRAFTIAAPLTEALKALSRQEQATLFMTLLAAFQAVLSRYSRQDDIVVATRIAGRARSETRPLIGFFVNALVLRADLSGDPTARELLRRVREVTLGAYAHQDLPFEKLVEELHPQRDLSRNPLFQVMFVLNNFPFATIELPGVTIQPIVLEAQTAKFDLDLAMSEVGGVLTGVLEYNTDVFAESTIERMLEHFQALLEGMTSNPDGRLSALPLMDAEEREQVLHTWNNTAAPYPHDTHLAALFAAQVERTPDAVALVFDNRPPTTDHRPPTTEDRGLKIEDSNLAAQEKLSSILYPLSSDQQAAFLHPLSLTYATLARQAYQLAHALQELGVGPEVVVTLALPRSPSSVIGLLAIEAAGGAVVPLDPSHPKAHLAALLEDTRPAVVLTASRYLDALPAHDAQVLCLDADAARIAQYPASAPATSVTAEHLAHIVYTSGSTGMPKGVAVPQRQLLHRLAWAAHTQPLAPSDRVGLRTAPSFSVAFAELLTPLLAGATAVLLPDPDAFDPPRLLAALRQHDITHLTVVPTLLRTLLDALDYDPRPLPHLRRLVVCGEMLPPDLLARAQARLPATSILHQYGASEVNDVCCFDTIALPPDAVRVPLGSPISNMQVYLLDEHLQPVPIGIPGQLYVGGAGLARGYHRRPDLTAERFIPCPWSVVSCQLQLTTDNGQLTTDNRLYRMGDLARWRTDGTLEYLGRADQQVKLRGVRVDLAGVEALLRGMAGVAQAAALVRNQADGTARLLAYVAPVEGLALDGPSLRRVLAARLPSGQVPEQVLVLPSLPRTPSGKLSRRALAELELESAAEAEPGSRAEPRTPLEELVGRIWAAVLGVESVGLHDNFFELGGHSLLATQVTARVREVCGVELPLRALFEAPTLAELAEQIAALRSEGAALALPPIVPVARSGAEPLSFAQQRLWFLEQLHPGYPFYNVPSALRLTGPLRVEALRASLGAVIARHEVLRTRFEVLDGHPAQVIAPPSEASLPIVELRGHAPQAREAEALRLATAEAQRPFDLAYGPLLRSTLLKLDEDDHVLLLTLHHTVADGWSTAVLVRELTTHYAALSAQSASSAEPRASSAELSALSAPLSAPLPIQYADFAHWQRRWLQGDGDDSPLRRQLAYWRRQLADLPTLDLPTDYARSGELTFHGATSAFMIPVALRDQLNLLSRHEGVTLFMTLLAAFQALLSRYSGQADVVVGTPIAGRTRAEIEQLIGCFVNTLVLRSDLSGNPTFRELLRRVREVCLGAYAHQDLPFEQLVEALQPQRDLHRQPLFQVLFILQNMTMPELAVADLAIRPLKIDRGTATFELALNLLETPEGLVGEVEYRTDLFAATTIERMIAHLLMVLEAAIADPGRRLSDLPLLPPHERQRLLATWNATGRDYPLDVPLHRLLEAQAERTPDAVALVFDRRQDDKMTRWPDDKMTPHVPRNTQHSTRNTFHASVTYGELNARANRLAHHLRSHGVGPEALVGVCLERSAELVVALLAVLKAGGAYLPLDPGYPAERLRMMLEDAQVSVVLTADKVTRRQGDKVSDSSEAITLSPPHPLTLSGSSVIALDAAWETIAQAPATSPDSGATADNLAYVIYTSGSTGKPKGAMNSHRAIVNRLLWMQEQYGLGADDRVLQKTPFSFDVSVWEFFWPLLTGATLVLARPGGHQDPAYLAELILQQRITTLHFVPAMLRVFLETPGVERCGIPTLPSPSLPLRAGVRIPQGVAGLRRVICSGEELGRALVERFFARLGVDGVELHNLYGPTEAAVDVSAWACRPADGAGRVPIGRPLANTQLYILDPQLQPVPVGVAGELYIGGVQLARGYLNRPDLTAERFVPCPLSVVSGQLQRTTDNGQRTTDNRLYKTGDLCRYREDGAIEYLGRLDTQVKLRGFRIELGEIEAALSAHPAVRAAVVALRNPDAGRGEDAPGGWGLVAYIVASQLSVVSGQLQPAENKEQRTENKEGAIDNGQRTTDNGLLEGEMRAFLAQKLPEYMVPAAFVLLDALPLTPSGKVDRRALPAVAPVAPVRAVVAPRTAVEARLVEQWRELLGVAEVSVEDNFFALGGHSLLLTQLAFRIPELFGVEVPLRALFDAPTVVAMTVVIAARQAEREDQAAIAQELEELRHLSPDQIKALLAAEEWS